MTAIRAPADAAASSVLPNPSAPTSLLTSTIASAAADKSDVAVVDDTVVEEEHDVDGEEILSTAVDPSSASSKFGSTSTAADAYCEILSLALEKTTTVAACTMTSLSCPGACLLDDVDDTNSGDVSQTVLPLLKDLKKDGKARAVALQNLYRMTDRERQRNRLPMICTTKFNVVRELLPCLSKEAAAADRRRALLLLTNLAIPPENKAVMLLSETIDDLMPALLRIVRGRWNESYLAAACLYNLSYLSDAKLKLVRYVAAQLELEDEDRTPALSYDFHMPEDHPCSLLRIMESLVKEYVGFVGAPSVDVGASVQREAVRWSMSTLRNLVTNVPDNAVLVGTKTDVPALAVTCLDLTDRDLVLWSPDSLEDSCLLLLTHVVVRPECHESLLRLLPDLERVYEKLRGKGGIHEVRAAAILGHLRDDNASQASKDASSAGEAPVVLVTTTVI